ncbi:MAG: helix-turn-helix transcriptional regulator [Adlercreutzia sp.]|uniref:helix-turn-helix domain-containing protein n=1 Tax=uncultured Adlercreutzia sp. TaxID=875803 RepID=UPI00216CA159|nr:helix-turn-helix transcriptional regulator [Adlercreutzia sp.]
MGKTKQIVGERIRALRNGQGLTQEQLGMMVGLNRVQISRLETGSMNTSLDNLDKVLDGLGCSIDELFR